MLTIRRNNVWKSLRRMEMASTFVSLNMKQRVRNNLGEREASAYIFAGSSLSQAFWNWQYQDSSGTGNRITKQCHNPKPICSGVSPLEFKWKLLLSVLLLGYQLFCLHRSLMDLCCSYLYCAQQRDGNGFTGSGTSVGEAYIPQACTHFCWRVASSQTGFSRFLNTLNVQ